MDNLLDGEIHLSAGGLTRHCVINTELKFHQFYTRRPDGLGLMPISRDCEDDECVDGSAISPATVYNMCMFLGLIVFEDKHQVVYMTCTVVVDLFQRPLQYQSVYMEPECLQHCSMPPLAPAFVS